MRSLILAGCVALTFGVAAGGHAADLSARANGMQLADASLVQAGRQALSHLDGNRFADALTAARAQDLRLLAKAVTWAWYRSAESPADFVTLARFIEDNPGWPNLDDIQRVAERRLAGVPNRVAMDFFQRHRPLTAPGLTAFAEGLEAMGRGADVPALIRAAWRDMPIPSDEAGPFLARYGRLLSEQDHIARLERLLWDGQLAPAEEQMRRVPESRRRLAAARIALQGRGGNVDGKIGAVPPSLQDDPGLMFDRLRWRRRAGMDAGALEIIRNKPAELGRPDAWWDEISIYARRALREGRAREAYALASDHGQIEGFALADAEFLSGFIALRYLNDPQTAFQHFKALFLAVSYPVSLSRGAYWAGRAAEAAGEPDIARQWYGEAARHLHTFYGQTAWLKLPPRERPTPPLEPLVQAGQQAAFDGLDLVRLIRLYHALGESDRAGPFIRHMTKLIDNEVNWTMTARLAMEINRPDLAVYVAREASKAGVSLSVTGFPALALNPGSVEDPALLLGLIRQESAFDLNARSHAGAMGLMQLMPGTAKLVANKLSLPYRPDALTRDPHYNTALGSAYLGGLIQNFDGSVVMALAGYNAGPSRARRWVQEQGDPRESLEKALDWIELIPFYETRNYVQRVLENATVYRWRLYGPQSGLVLKQDRSLAGEP